MTGQVARRTNDHSCQPPKWFLRLRRIGYGSVWECTCGHQWHLTSRFDHIPRPGTARVSWPATAYWSRLGSRITPTAPRGARTPWFTGINPVGFGLLAGAPISAAITAIAFGNANYYGSVFMAGLGAGLIAGNYRRGK